MDRKIFMPAPGRIDGMTEAKRVFDGSGQEKLQQMHKEERMRVIAYQKKQVRGTLKSENPYPFKG